MKTLTITLTLEEYRNLRTTLIDAYCEEIERYKNSENFEKKITAMKQAEKTKYLQTIIYEQVKKQ